MKKILVISFAFLFFVITKSHAQDQSTQHQLISSEWRQVANSDGMKVFVNTKSIKRIKNEVTIWTLNSFSEYQQLVGSGNKFRSMKVKQLFNCDSETSYIYTISWYEGQHGDGKVVLSDSYPNPQSNLSHIVPGSVGEATYSFACSYKRKK
ncbi:MAG: hypothetical protein GX776_06960 [Oxalobacter sp.]|nr:hypothetical protein [Oxalobacter sp.]